MNATVEWSGCTAGVRSIGVDLRGTAGGRELIIGAVERGEPHIIVVQEHIEELG